MCCGQIQEKVRITEKQISKFQTKAKVLSSSGFPMLQLIVWPCTRHQPSFKKKRGRRPFYWTDVDLLRDSRCLRSILSMDMGRALNHWFYYCRVYRCCTLITSTGHPGENQSFIHG